MSIIKYQNIKKVFFYCIFLLVFIIGASETCLQLIFFDYKSDPYITLESNPILERIYQDGEIFYQLKNMELFEGPNRVLVKKIKDEGVIRIVGVGGSAAMGYPRVNEFSYLYLVGKELSQLYPNRKIEVINAARQGYPSYRVLNVVREIIEIDPDVVIIYSGNNEMLEKRTFPESILYKLLLKSKIFRLSMKSISSIKLKLKFKRSRSSIFRFELISKAKKDALELRVNNDLFEKVKQHYSFSIRQSVKILKKNGIKTILMTVPSNIRGWIPNVSIKTSLGERLKKWNNLYHLGISKYYKGDYRNAEKLFEGARNIDFEHAENLYFLAKTQEKLNKLEEARKNYILAKDFDHNPFRAHSAFNETVKEIAVKEKIMLVDLDEIFQRKGGYVVPGFDLFLDYCHPSTLGNVIIATEIINKLMNVKDLKLKKRKVVKQRVINLINEKDSYFMNAYLLFAGIIMHQYEYANSIAENILSLEKDSPGLYIQEIIEITKKASVALKKKIGVAHRQVSLDTKQNIEKDFQDIMNVKNDMSIYHTGTRDYLRQLKIFRERNKNSKFIK